MTDSGTSAMSCYQWEGMTNTGDTPYSSRHYLKMVEEFREILGYNYIIPTHQGRAAEHIMSQCMIKPGQIVPGNMYFTTTKLHQEMAGGVFVDVIVDEAHDPTNPFPWKGNIDLKKLENEIQRVGPEKVAYVSFETCVNMAGGQPISMQNAKDVSKLLHKYGIPNMYDATRCVENAYMIKWKDPQYSDKPVKEILRELLSYGDGCTISAKKDFLVNMGGLIACNSPDLNRAFLRMLRVWEGDVTNGGLDSKDIEALHRGLMDSLDDDYIKMRIAQTQEFGRKLQEAGVPIVVPFRAGEHGGQRTTQEGHRRSRIQHVPAQVGRRLPGPVDRQRHVGHELLPVGGDDQHRRHSVQQPPLPEDGRGVPGDPGLQLHHPDPPGPGRGAHHVAVHDQAGADRARQHVLHHHQAPPGDGRRSVRGRHCGRSARSDQPVPVEGQHRLEEAGERDSARRPGERGLRQFRDLREHGRRAADIHAERQGRVEAAAQIRHPRTCTTPPGAWRTRT